MKKKEIKYQICLGIKISLAVLCLFTFHNNTLAKIRLPKTFSSDMVIQRDRPIKLWGWADPGEKVSVSFLNHNYTAIASKKGEWQIIMAAATAGGPYILRINDISLNNVLLGDVWLCSGQSNMEFQLKNAEGAAAAITISENSKIRLLTIPADIDFKPLNELSSTVSWQMCNPQTVKDFSAVAYFMVDKLQRELNIPIGIINSSYGGTTIEGFISQRFLDTVARLKPIYDETKNKTKEQFINLKTEELTKRFGKLDFYSNDNVLWDTIKPVIPTISDKWPKMKLPTLWERAGLPNVDGVIWFYKDIDLTKKESAKSAFLSLGRIADQSVVFLNGKKLGSSIDSRDFVREYQVPVGFLKEGTNRILVRVANKGRNGGIWGPASKLFFKPEDSDKIMIDGDWYFNIQYVKVAIHPNDIPSSIYNAMINPLRNIQFKGVVWYQGESSANWANEYAGFLKSLIKDWRENFNQPKLPFIVIQLPNYKKISTIPDENSSWALLREAQEQSLKLDNVGLVVTIDQGMENNIHPIYKKPVGERTALKVLQMCYNKEVVADGPVYKNIDIEGDKMLVYFKDPSGIVISKSARRTNFMIAGEDRKFVWADAKLENGKIVVWSDKILKPVALRYAWADNPGDNYLYGKNGLPARPFRTDNWKILLENIPR